MEYTYMPISTGNDKVKVTASSLIIRKEPGGEDTGSRYHRRERIAPIEKAVYASERWFRQKEAGSAQTISWAGFWKTTSGGILSRDIPIRKAA